MDKIRVSDLWNGQRHAAVFSGVGSGVFQWDRNEEGF